MKTYKIKCRRGVDDLLSVYAFIGNSQGDTSASNEIEAYKAAKGWMSYVFTDIDITDQEAIYAEANRRQKANIDYIKRLAKEGRLHEEYEITIDLVHNPLYDDKQDFIASVESYRMIFLDFSKDE